MKTFETTTGELTVDFETFDGAPLFTVIHNGDVEVKESESCVRLSNHQAYQLALHVLTNIEVQDSRGGN
ncbi:MAG: hypothetical protein Tp125SUR00d2C35697761_5 [Prokaryotic dsDNA virus sp.]|nr:MAG: hypothetical protein Tp125SUR00d2C35697761_5 [Prokaryotic dsDNA virus sp.]|tara:strand:- start:4406 stop:4612 length:207 start_codon:yes stop_codon:yes gene_type:complete